MSLLKQKNKSAFSLLETIVVLLVISVGLVSILSVTVDSVRAQNLNKNSLVAYRLSEEGIELIKNVRDTNFKQNSTSTPIAWDRYITGSASGTPYRVDYATFEPAEVAGISEAKLQIATGTDAGFYLHDDSYADSLFSRLITIVSDTAASSTISSLVTWNDQGQDYQIELKTIIYDWDY